MKSYRLTFGAIAGMIFLLMTTGCAMLAKSYSPTEIAALKPSGKIVNDVRVISVTAKRYQFDPDPIVVRSGEHVRLEITSLDVTHGFALPAYKIDAPVHPGETTTVTFTAGKSGSYPIHCDIYCGLGHPTMRATLVVKPAQS